MYQPPKLKFNLNAPETFKNLAEDMQIDERAGLADHLIELIEKVDLDSMSAWLGEAEGYLDRVDGENQDAPTNTEQSGSNEDTQPPSTALTLTAVIQFAARATDALLGEPDLAKASEPGGEPLADWVSRQLRTEDQNWTLETDPLVVHMSVTGLAWRKRKYDREDKTLYSRFLTVKQVIINANVVSVNRAPRITEDFERYPYEIGRSIERGHWVDYEPRFDDRDPQKPHRFYECDAWVDLDGDGIVEPWIFTIAREDRPQIVKIEPRWSKKTIVNNNDELFFKPAPRYYPYKFLPDPKGTFLPKGFGWLLKRAEASADNLLASIVDTAKSEAENGGVMSGTSVGLPEHVEIKGNRITSIPNDGAPLNNTFQPFPSKSVSSGSVAVLEKVITLGDRLAGTLNMLENAPASMTATLAKGLIDNGMQVQSAVHRRLCSMLTQEMRAMVQMADAFDVLPEGVMAASANQIAVTADPQLATEMQRTAMAGLYQEIIKIGIESQGTVFNPVAAGQRLLQVLRIPSPEELAGQSRPAEATPFEKIKGVVEMEKQRTARIQAIADVAVKMTQAIKNAVDAQGGMQNMQLVQLQMAQLEDTVQRLMQESSNAGSGFAQLAPPSGDGGASGTLPAPGQGAGSEVLGGDGGGAGDAGAGSGLG
jgi:hypothetical protein